MAHRGFGQHWCVVNSPTAPGFEDPCSARRRISTASAGVPAPRTPSRPRTAQPGSAGTARARRRRCPRWGRRRCRSRCSSTRRRPVAAGDPGAGARSDLEQGAGPRRFQHGAELPGERVRRVAGRGAEVFEAHGLAISRSQTKTREAISAGSPGRAMRWSKRTAFGPTGSNGAGRIRRPASGARWRGRVLRSRACRRCGAGRRTR